MNKMKVLEFSGRGLSFRDAVSLGSINSDGNIETIADYSIYKSGILRFKRMGKRAIPVIRYQGKTDDELCVAFRIEEGEKAIDIDVQLVAEALTYYAQQNNTFT